MSDDNIHGNLLDPNDKDRLDKWREDHFYSFAGIEEDPELPSNEFRTAGNKLHLASDFYARTFGSRPRPPHG